MLLTAKFTTLEADYEEDFYIYIAYCTVCNLPCTRCVQRTNSHTRILWDIPNSNK